MQLKHIHPNFVRDVQRSRQDVEVDWQATSTSKQEITFQYVWFWGSPSLTLSITACLSASTQYYSLHLFLLVISL